MSSELADVVVSREMLENTGYISLEQVAQEAEETLDTIFVGSLKSEVGYEFRGTISEYEQFMLGAVTLTAACYRSSAPTKHDREKVFRALCFGRNFATLLRQYQPPEYDSASQLNFDGQVDAQAVYHALLYAKGRDSLTYYANTVAIGNSIAIGRPGLHSAARIAVLYVFMQAEQQAYDSFIGLQVASFRDELNA